MNAELADLSPIKRETLQPGEGKRDKEVGLDVYVEEQMIGGLLPQQDIAAIKALILRAQGESKSN